MTEEEQRPIYKFTGQKKEENKGGKKFQWASEDNSDLTDFYSMLPREKFAKKYKF